MPKLSIILPVYNGEKYLEQAITSILNQSFKDWELICIDDGSTDDSVKILENHNNQLLLIKSSHKGVAAARNQGVAAASGNFITYLDADDVYMPNALSRQFKTYENDTSIGLKVILGKSQVNFESDDLRQNYYFNVNDSNKTAISLLGATLIPVAVMNTIGKFNELLVTGSDYEWFMKLKDHNVQIVYNDSVVLNVNRHHQNLTKNFSTTKRAHLELLRNRIKAKRQKPFGE